MNKLTFSAFVAFWASTLTIIALGALAPERVAQAGAQTPPTVTRAELAKHDQPGDCWMAIRGNVYDFSDYVPMHPTPPAVVTQWCGQEATEAYETKGYGRPHSPGADAQMVEYLIGELEKDGED